MKKLRRILVVDGSRVVRATLSKHLKDDFEILEEGNGESAWQTLMLDANIAAVVSGAHPPKLEAHDLLARLRASSMRRLREMPFVLIVSDVENQVEREFDQSRGVAGFITKTMKKSAIVACLVGLLEPAARPRTETPLVSYPVENVKSEEKPAIVAVPWPEPEKVLDSAKLKSVLSALSFANPLEEKVCALVFGIDNRDALIARFGEDAAGMIAARFASLLVSKVGARDLIGRCKGERLAIISHGVDLKQGVRFGKQVCKSLASGQISIRGQTLKLTASAGVASTSDDAVSTGNELFSLADQRLNQALVCGGNTVATEFKPECPLHCQDKGTFQLLAALNSRGGEKNVSTNIGVLGLKILPLLQRMDKELALGLPLANIKKQLLERASLDDEAAI